MKKFNLEATIGEDGKLNLKSSNNGFTAFEIIGILEFKKRDIEMQIYGKIKPDIVTRELIKDTL